MFKLKAKNLRQTFSTSRYLQLSDEVKLPDSPSMRAQWVIGRSQCLYKIFDLQDTPRARRKDALNILIQRWSPFDKTGQHIVWDQSIAMVWVWDQSKTSERIADLGIQTQEVLPESVFRPRHTDCMLSWPSIDGGISYQIWIGELLAAEKWFKNTPDDKALERFFRSLNLPRRLMTDPTVITDGPREAIATTETELLDRPWGSRNQQLLPLLVGIKLEQWLVASTAIILASILVWNIGATLTLLLAEHQVQKRLSTFSDEVSTVLTARDEAITKSRQANELLKLLDFPSQKALMASIAPVILAQNASIKDWTYNLDKLEIIVEGERIQTLDLLKSLEAISFVQSVTLDKANRPNQHKFTLTLHAHE
jgi:hypothetical protein